MQRPDGPRSKPCAWLKEVGVRAQHNVISKSLLSECVGWTNEQPEPVVNTGVGRTLLFSRTLMSDFLGSTPTFIVHQAFDPHREPSCVTWALTPGCISILWPPPRCLRARARGGAVTCLRRAQSLTLKCRSA